MLIDHVEQAIPARGIAGTAIVQVWVNPYVLNPESGALTGTPSDRTRHMCGR